jgi:hypothetical protein
MTVLEAMAHMEGFFEAGSRPARNHNPLDLEWGGEARIFGATAGDPRFAIFPDDQTGWNAGRRWLSVPAKFDANGKLVAGYLGATVEQAINRFAPPDENNDRNYIGYVCSQAECQRTDILTAEILG